MDLRTPVAVLVLALLSGCHAVQGLGKDIENLGLIIQEKINPSASREGYSGDGCERVVGEAPYAQELIDWNQPIESDVGQNSTGDEKRAEPLSSTP